MADALSDITLDTKHEMHDVVSWHLSQGIFNGSGCVCRGRVISDVIIYPYSGNKK